LLIYSYFRKVSTSDEEAETLKRRLKEVVAEKEEELLLLGQHSAVMECKASEASKARDRTEDKLAKLSEDFKGLQAEHVKLQ
jgi:hypothetical protein